MVKSMVCDCIQKVRVRHMCGLLWCTYFGGHIPGFLNFLHIYGAWPLHSVCNDCTIPQEEYVITGVYVMYAMIFCGIFKSCCHFL